MQEDDRISMYVTRGCLVVPIQHELEKNALQQIQVRILEKVYALGLKNVIIDVSGVDIIDLFIGQQLFSTAKMTALLGTRTVITGLGPGAAASLVDLGFEQENIMTAVDLEAGFALLDSLARQSKPRTLSAAN